MAVQDRIRAGITGGGKKVAEIQHVDAGGKVRDMAGRLRKKVETKNVAARSSGERVRAVTGNENVVAVAAVELRGIIVGSEDIGERVAPYGLRGRADQFQILEIAGKSEARCRAQHRIDAVIGSFV